MPWQNVNWQRIVIVVLLVKAIQAALPNHQMKLIGVRRLTLVPCGRKTDVTRVRVVQDRPNPLAPLPGTEDCAMRRSTGRCARGLQAAKVSPAEANRPTPSILHAEPGFSQEAGFLRESLSK